MRLPGELLLQVFSMLRYEHLVQVQLCCRSWKCLAQDASLWKERCRSITQQHQDLDERKDTSLSWLQRYCQLRTGLHWKLGIVERATLINISSSRLLSVKLRGKLLLTLSEDNMVHLYEYDTAQGFVSRCTWKFCGQRQVECIDLLPEINTVVVACRGSKCYFYDISSKSPTEPIQVLKGGSHAWFIPDDVSLTCDYFAVSGRKPSAVFVWNWRKGVQLALKALNNEPHAVHISGDHLMTVSGEGNVEVQHLFEDLIYPVTQVPPCSIPSHNYDAASNDRLAYASIIHNAFAEAPPLNLDQPFWQLKI
ncbi:hypothetical protein DM01DRAFT_157658 [Hesseltinella vesiculosa]|uniref:F-box domain-containing protein n=1 Tax=Hesseltinella vesiculosa TaxID=101127 RepID=A0A1X2G5R4_9FUNG|nr:hypothetical protein DM01DRAFT_157658 [Hesseltinella vesiculosa]